MSRFLAMWLYLAVCLFGIGGLFWSFYQGAMALYHGNHYVLLCVLLVLLLSFVLSLTTKDRGTNRI